MTNQERADAYLAAWQLLRHLPPLLRMALIETLCEIERAKAEKFAPRANLLCT